MYFHYKSRYPSVRGRAIAVSQLAEYRSTSWIPLHPGPEETGFYGETDKKLLTRTLLQWIPATGVTPPTELADMGSVPILQVASTAPNAATPLIDLDAAAQRLGGNRAFFDQIAQAFRDDAAAQSEQALKAMNISAPEDQETAKRLWQVLGEQFALVLDELTAIPLPVAIAVPAVATAAAAIHTQLRADMLRSLATMLGAGNSRLARCAARFAKPARRIWMRALLPLKRLSAASILRRLWRIARIFSARQWNATPSGIDQGDAGSSRPAFSIRYGVAETGLQEGAQAREYQVAVAILRDGACRRLGE
jgi:hypothetical protein